MRGWWWAAAVGVVLPLGLLLAAQLGALSGRPPADLGVREGRLKAPSDTPNSVSSQAGLYPGHPQAGYAAIEPLRLAGTPEQALARAARVLATWPRLRVVTQAGTYLHAEHQTAWLRFTDDLELYAVPAEAAGQSLLHVRSASRLGRRDFGVNRERVEALRQAVSSPASDRR